MSLAGLLNSSVAGHGDQGLVDVNLVCNKDTHKDTHIYMH